VKRYWVYILTNRSGTLYIGVTGRLARRIEEHRESVVSCFTSWYRLHRLVHVEEFDDVYLALEREKQIKRWRRSKKVALIEGANPDWEDLA